MNFKNIFVYLDGSDRSQLVMEVAAQLAKHHGARLSGLHVIGFPLPTQIGTDSSGPFGALAPTHSAAAIRESALARADRAGKIFMAQLEQAGLAGDWYTPEGMVAYTAGVYARCFDVTIVGQIDPADPPLGTRRLVPEALLLESGRPVLILPCSGHFNTIGETVLVGWDGSPEAARAVNDALPILERARSVEVLTFVYGERATGSEEADPAAVVAHLDQHGIRAVSSKRMVETETVARALLDHAARTQADLLVMGGYGHPRLREMMLGGTTRSVLREMTLPIFMAH